MTHIIAIETSGCVCSAAIIIDGKCVAVREFTPQCGAQMQHSALLAPYIDELLTERQLTFADIDAVAVSAGPGSYTGLRIGLSTAKGLCMGSSAKLILVDSLVPLVNAAITNCHPHTMLCPMVDARRMEVYCAMYNPDGKQMTDIKPVVVDNDTFAQYAGQSITIFGSGAAKCEPCLTAARVNVTVLDIDASAAAMANAAQIMFDNKEFADIAYSEPLYLKEFVGTKPKNLATN